MLRELDEAARALVAPRVVLFDWHATLVDTLEAMYHAVDDMLPLLPDLGLMDALIKRTATTMAKRSRSKVASSNSSWSTMAPGLIFSM
jgi:beta-phosphoglucomutase-like phosphatase (HAD superfamily)